MQRLGLIWSFFAFVAIFIGGQSSAFANGAVAVAWTDANFEQLWGAPLIENRSVMSWFDPNLMTDSADGPDFEFGPEYCNSASVGVQLDSWDGAANDSDVVEWDAVGMLRNHEVYPMPAELSIMQFTSEELGDAPGKVLEVE